MKFPRPACQVPNRSATIEFLIVPSKGIHPATRSSLLSSTPSTPRPFLTQRKGSLLLSPTSDTPQMLGDFGKDLLAAIDAADADLRQLSIEIHDHPELGYQEHFAHKLLTNYLEKQGFNVTHHACEIKTAFIAEFVHEGRGGSMATAGDPMRAVGFCSEFDALPSIGHGCGHNLIAISGVAAVLGLKATMEKNKIRGKVRLLGTPAEETLGGKRPMLERGAFKGLDVCMMVHPGQFDVLYRQPLGVGRLEIDFHGKASHASTSPWEGMGRVRRNECRKQGTVC